MGTLVVTIPAYNEEKTIGDVIRKVPRDLAETTKIVVINDGSTDKTGQIAREAGAEIITFKRNRGLAEAFRKAMIYAISSDAKIVVNIDADGQYEPAEIKDLIQPIQKGEADVVLGSRFKGYIESMPLLKRIGNIAFTKLIKILTKEQITDGQTGFRAFTHEVAETLDIQGRYSYTQQMIIQASYHRFEIVEIPVKFYARMEGESRLVRSPIHYAYKALEILFLVTVMYYPLKFFGIIGLLLIFFGVILGLTFIEWNVLSSLIISTGILFILSGMLFKLIRTKNKV